MSESRTELLTWLNDLCKLNYTKVEQCGSGAAHLLIMDSIYRDVPLSKCKLQAKHEYEYVANYKILQAVFDKHKISNIIPVERLIKCKFQDNLEFLQLMKKYWDQYYPGGSYDLTSRKPASGSAATKTTSPVKSAPRAPAGAAGAGRASSGSVASSSAPSAIHLQQIKDLTARSEVLDDTVNQITKERDFYFSKLREIELFVQSSLDGVGGHEKASKEESLKHIQAIMYKTEDGFDVPAQEDEVAAAEAA